MIRNCRDWEQKKSSHYFANTFASEQRVQFLKLINLYKSFSFHYISYFSLDLNLIV